MRKCHDPGQQVAESFSIDKTICFFETRHPKLMQTEVPVVASLVLLGVVRAHVNHCEPWIHVSLLRCRGAPSHSCVGGYLGFHWFHSVSFSFTRRRLFDPRQMEKLYPRVMTHDIILHHITLYLYIDFGGNVHVPFLWRFQYQQHKKHHATVCRSGEGVEETSHSIQRSMTCHILSPLAISRLELALCRPDACVGKPFLWKNITDYKLSLTNTDIAPTVAGDKLASSQSGVKPQMGRSGSVSHPSLLQK